MPTPTHTVRPRVLHVLRDGALDGPENMARDEHLLHADEMRPAALRTYMWDPPTLSLGYFQRYATVAELPEDVRDLAVVRRITGGGAILHDLELTYCLVLDQSVPVAQQSPIELYRLVHACWRGAIEADGHHTELAPAEFPLPTPRTGPFFCFEKPGQTDLLLGTDKVLGSAQRRQPDRLLQHGSLLLGRRFASHPGAHLGNPPPETVAAWIERFVQQLGEALALEPQTREWTNPQRADVASRRSRYASAPWTQRR